MKYLLTGSILLLPFSADISFANDRGDEQTSTVEKTENELPTISGLTDVENKFLTKAGELANISNTPASDLIAFMKENRLSSSIAKKLKDLLERFQYKISEKPGGGISISYSKEDRIQADDDINGSYNIISKNRAQNLSDYTPTCPYHYVNMTNDDIAIRIQTLDKTMRLVSSDIGLLNDSITSTSIKLDGIVHNLNNIIKYIQMTDGYKWQSFLKNSKNEKNNQFPKEYIVSMDNLSKTLNDMSTILKQDIEQRTNVQNQVIQQPCQQVSTPQYIDNLNQTIADLSIILQQALKHNGSQDKQQCQSCLINEQINKASNNKAASEHIKSLESIHKILLGMSEQLNDIINYKYDYCNVRATDLENKLTEQDRINAIANLNASLINISNELQNVTNKIEQISHKGVNITVIGQGGLQSSNASNAHDRIVADDSNHKQEVIDKILKNEHTWVIEEVDEDINTEKSIIKDDINTEESREIGATSEITTTENKEDNISTEKTEESLDVKQVEESVSHEKVEETPAEEQKNLGIVKKEIAAFENLIENNGSKAGHNGIVENDSNTSKYNEIKTELEGEVKNDGQELTPANVPPPPPLLPELVINEKETKNLIVPTIPPAPQLLAEYKKVDENIDKEAEKEAAYERFLEKRRLEREKELRQIRGIEDDDSAEKTSITPPPPPPAPTLDLSQLSNKNTIQKSSTNADANTKSSKKLGIVAEMAKRFEELKKDGPQAGHNGIVKKDSPTSGYNEIKKHIKKKKKHK